jgi:iron(III) transport system permease protein
MPWPPAGRLRNKLDSHGNHPVGAAPQLIKRSLGYLPLLVLLAAMTALPLIILLLTSLVPDGSHPLDAAKELTFEHYREVFADPYTYQLLANTFVFAGGSLLLGMTIAITMAWFVERTDMPFKQYAYIAIFLPMAMPGFITAIGWTFLLNPTNGIINVAMRGLFGLDDDYGPFNAYSVGGMILVAGLSIGPTMFIMLSSVMRNLDPSLEDSAYASGASNAAVMRRVVIPLLRPGLLSIFIYFFVTAIEMLEIPLIFGPNANFNVLSVTVYRKTAGGDVDLPNYGLSSTYAILGLIIGFALLLLYFRLMRQADRYAVITGKGYRPKEYKLRPLAKCLAVAFFVLFIVLKLVLPLLVLLWSSALPYFQSPSWEALQTLTFKNYIALFQMDRFAQAVGNTALMMVATAACCMVLAAIVAWVVVRGRGALAKAIDVLAFLPHLLPGLVIALALLLTSVGTPLYGTLSVIAIGNIIRYLPFGVRIMTSVMYQVSAELEDAAYASGASRLTTFRRIVLPLVLPAFINGIVWVGSHAMKDMTLPLFLVSTSNIVIAGLMWETWNRGSGELTAAISVMLVAVLLCIIAPVQLALRRRVQRLDAAFREAL